MCWFTCTGTLRDGYSFLTLIFSKQHFAITFWNNDRELSMHRYFPLELRFSTAFFLLIQRNVSDDPGKPPGAA